MRLELFFDVNGQRPSVLAKRRTKCVDTVIEGAAEHRVALPAGDKSIFVESTTGQAFVTLLVPLLTEDGQIITDESGLPILVEGGSAMEVVEGTSFVLPARAQHRSLSLLLGSGGKCRVTVTQ